jgi:hypothetical protein
VLSRIKTWCGKFLAQCDFTSSTTENRSVRVGRRSRQLREETTSM